MDIYDRFDCMKPYIEMILHFKFKVMNQMIWNVYSMHIYIHKESTKEISKTCLYVLQKRDLCMDVLLPGRLIAIKQMYLRYTLNKLSDLLVQS